MLPEEEPGAFLIRCLNHLNCWGAEALLQTLFRVTQLHAMSLKQTQRISQTKIILATFFKDLTLSLNSICHDLKCESDGFKCSLMWKYNDKWQSPESSSLWIAFSIFFLLKQTDPGLVLVFISFTWINLLMSLLKFHSHFKRFIFSHKPSAYFFPSHSSKTSSKVLFVFH